MPYWEVYFIVAYLKGIVSIEPCNLAVTMVTTAFLRKIRRYKSSKIPNNFSWHRLDMLNHSLKLLYPTSVWPFSALHVFHIGIDKTNFSHFNWSNIFWYGSTNFFTSTVRAEQMGSEDLSARRHTFLIDSCRNLSNQLGIVQVIHKFLRASFYNFHAEQRNGQNNVHMPSTRQFVPFSIHKNNSMQTEISQSCVRTQRKK